MTVCCDEQTILAYCSPSPSITLKIPNLSNKTAAKYKIERSRVLNLQELLQEASLLRCPNPLSQGVHLLPTKKCDACKKKMMSLIYAHVSSRQITLLACYIHQFSPITYNHWKRAPTQKHTYI